VQQRCSNIGNAKALVTQLEVDVPSTLAALEKSKASGAITFFNPSPAPRGASALQAWSHTCFLACILFGSFQTIVVVMLAQWALAEVGDWVL
jgi:hypothetical protein